jgi:hypothetical protein
MQGNGLIFASILQGGTALVKAMPEGALKVVIPNQLQFTEDIGAKLLQAAPAYWYPQPGIPLPAQPDWIVNACADADSFADALGFLDASYQHDVPIFNHPRAVMAARRDNAGFLLQNVAGLEVPHCRRFRGTSPKSFSDCFERGGFHYPVTVYPTSVRNGVCRLRISNESEWETVLRMGGGGRQYVMVQSMAEEAAAPLCLRIVILGRSYTVVELPQAQPGRKVSPPYKPSPEFLDWTIKSILRRMPLDYWTLDVAVTAADRLRLLDISVGLHAPDEEEGLPRVREQVTRLMSKLAPRLLSVLDAPAQWRHDARRLPSVADVNKREQRS